MIPGSCSGQEISSQLRGDNVDILCAGQLAECECQVRSLLTRHLLTSYPGTQEDGLCHCDRTSLGPDQLVVTRALCCTSRMSQSGVVVCPPHLPHTARFRSQSKLLSCPQPSSPYKCVCLGTNR